MDKIIEFFKSFTVSSELSDFEYQIVDESLTLPISKETWITKEDVGIEMHCDQIEISGNFGVVLLLEEKANLYNLLNVLNLEPGVEIENNEEYKEITIKTLNKN